MPANIVLVTGSLQGGGAERVLADMANYWAGKGWNVTLATMSGRDIEDFYDLHPKVDRRWMDIQLPRSAIFSRIRTAVLRVFALRKLLLKLKPDTVLSFIHIPNVMTILAATGLETRVVVSERTHPALDTTISFGWRAVRKICYPWSDKIVAQTPEAANWISKKFHLQAAVVPNPLRLMPRLSYERQNVIVAVGRLSKEKGFDLLIRAFAEIACGFKDWEMVIVGHGGEREKLLQLRDQLMLTTRVNFVGQVKNVEYWMARAGLVVQPSRYEGFPNVVLESMSMGAAVICADCQSGPSELIDSGVNGWLVPVEDVPILSQVMAKLMSQPSLREALGREAKKIRQHYRQDKIMALWEAVALKSKNAT